MNINFRKKEYETPFAETSLAKRGSRQHAPDYYGGFSLEKFADAGDLFYTHEDAQGWLNYVGQFQHLNFWYKDSGVGIWAYYEDYDNWQDTYGMDAVMAVYHSGHGGMGSDGKFYAPLGYNWGGAGTTAVSDQMRIGNEQANYIFWSTCLSLRVLDGHNPIRTWQPANLGFRMLFGFETVSWDDPNYGRYFWQEWNKGKSFSTAWLDASWRIAHDQSPSVVACGMNADEARNRVFNERYFYWDHVSTNYWWWRWYYAARTATASRDLNLALPKELLIAYLKPIDTDENYIAGIIQRYGIESKLPSDIVASEGNFFLKEGQTRVAFGNDGRYEVQFSQPNLSNRIQIPLDQVKSIANDTIRRYGLDQEVSLIFDQIMLAAEGGGGNVEERTRIEGPYITETIVQFRQVINGLPVITPGAGEVKISIDNDASITSIHSSIRPIEWLSDRPINTTANPMEEGPIARSRVDVDVIGPDTRDSMGYEQLLAEEWQKRLASWVIRGKAPLQYAVIPGSTEIGYDIRGNEAALVVRRAVEADFGNGYRKRYWIIATILE